MNNFLTEAKEAGVNMNLAELQILREKTEKEITILKKITEEMSWKWIDSMIYNDDFLDQVKLLLEFKETKRGGSLSSVNKNLQKAEQETAKRISSMLKHTLCPLGSEYFLENTMKALFVLEKWNNVFSVDKNKSGSNLIIDFNNFKKSVNNAGKELKEGFTKKWEDALKKVKVEGVLSGNYKKLEEMITEITIWNTKYPELYINEITDWESIQESYRDEYIKDALAQMNY